MASATPSLHKRLHVAWLVKADDQAARTHVNTFLKHISCDYQVLSPCLELIKSITLHIPMQ
jgi:hypothetical protein